MEYRECGHCGGKMVQHKANTRSTPAGMISARDHGKKAGKAFEDGDVVGGIRHMVTPFLGPLASKAVEVVLQWRCLKCGKHF